ncbi:GAF domain-containing protein [Pedobacter frigidisoli]|uniref:GAF domain-containing protein n=1 Tax=Pedobacter frigidisoli TaxID=2530455 RepID=A0A4R0P5W3_9SPHI|nr:GAF domain-containing protein [Pedobacter frigidisoli]TCD08269.1 GAF domain-containing protein [Pedobacter frigidisoli]
MNTDVIQIHKNECINCQVGSSLSFRPLVEYLKDRLKTEKSVKSEFYRFLLQKIEKDDVLLGTISAEELSKYKDTLELIFTILTPLMDDEDDLFWALSTPIPDQIFFSTNAFYKFFKDHDPKNKVGQDSEPVEKKQLKFIYNIILGRFYNFTSVLKNEIIYGHINQETKLTQYYNIQTDTKFVDIIHKGDLPEINFEELGRHFQEDTELEYLVKNLPLGEFHFEGFSIISITDVTLQHAIDGIRNALVNHNYQTEAYTHVIQALKSLSGDGRLEFGLMPFLTVNKKLVFDNKEFSQSMLINSAKASNLEEEVFYSLVDKYKENPRAIFVSAINDDQITKDPFLKVLKAAGVCSYSVLPIYYNTQLAGVLEVYSNQEVLVDDKLLSRLRSALPLIGQLFQYSIEEFDSKMDEVLMDKFTALQPSVQWKFNEAVWHFLQGKNSNRKLKEIETVTFKNMYPLFGAIDIRNSTTERNKALKDDLNVLLNSLIDTLKAIRKMITLDLTDKLLFNCKDWIKRIGSFASSNEENQLNEFLENEVYPFLSIIKGNYPETAETINNYFQVIVPATGDAYANRRQLEVSMQLINTEVSQYLEKSQAKLQASYPCYFAKFRTDGVEYDIYIGQEIAPEKPFDLLYLKNIRLWQLTSMVEIARLSKGLIGEMPRPLETTQMIFIHSNAIDISFRNDERRFDVEGAYNIRYEVVKKRIDKVLIKGTTERLTQPHKIALVYFNQDEAKEYMEYIKYMQVQGFLNDDLEGLELDELQGVSGLKALRVGVKYLDNKKESPKKLKASELKSIEKEIAKMLQN